MVQKQVSESAHCVHAIHVHMVARGKWHKCKAKMAAGRYGGYNSVRRGFQRMVLNNSSRPSIIKARLFEVAVQR